jgi:hypothetical protein
MILLLYFCKVVGFMLLGGIITYWQMEKYYSDDNWVPYEQEEIKE